MKLPEDPFVLELLPEFVDTWIDDLNELYPKYLKERNKDDLYRLAHTLKGSCFQFNLDEIAQMGLDLMAHLKEDNWNKAEEMEAPIKNAFADVDTYLKEKGIK